MPGLGPPRPKESSAPVATHREAPAYTTQLHPSHFQGLFQGDHLGVP
jgi:hypothetical protein